MSEPCLPPPSVTRTHRWVRRVIGMLLSLVSISVWAAPPTEYELKAAFLFNFARFIEWPAGVLPPAHQPIVIGIVGDNPFGASLDEIVQGETIQGHPLVVRRFSRQDDFTICQIVYVGRSETKFLPRILGLLKGRPILTVSDADRFAYAGGMIGLVMEQGRVRLQINLDRAKGAELVISAKLLRSALVIRDDSGSLLARPWSVCSLDPVELPRSRFRGGAGRSGARDVALAAA